MTIDSSQRVLIGTSSSITGYYLQIAENSGYAGVSALRYTNDAFGSYLNLGKSRTTTIGGNTIVQDNDVVGYITFSPNDGTDLFSISSQIQGEIDGTPGANDVPGRLVFKTTADGASYSTERMRITSSGNVGIASGGDVGLDSTDIALQVGSGSLSNPTIQIRSSSSGTGQLWFGDNSGSDAGRYDGFIQYNQTDRFMYFGTAQSNALRIDSDQRTIIGGYSHIPVINASVQASVVGGSADSGSGGLGVARFGGPPVIALASSPNTTVGSFTLTSNGTAMGYLYYGADDGTDIRTAGAYIGAVVDGTPGANDMPGRLVFATTADGASSSTERMRINNSGDVTIGNAANARARLEVYDSDVSAVYAAGDLSTWRVMQVRNNIESFSGTAAGIAFGGDGSGDTETAGIVGISDNSTGGIMQLAFITATGNNSLEAMRIDSSQRVLIGADSNQEVLLSSGNQVQIQGINSNQSAISITRHTNDGGGPYVNFGKTRGTADGAVTVVQNADVLGQVFWSGADGTDIKSPAAGIQGLVDGTPGSNDMPGRLSFLTTADGTNVVTERMRIDSAGRVIINTQDVSTGTGTNKGLLQVAMNQGSGYYWTDINTGANQYASMPNEIAVLNTPDSQLNSYAGIFFQPGETSAGSTISAARIGAIRESTGNIGTALGFATRSGTGMAENMRISSDGYVGIGTTSPSQKITVGFADNGTDGIAFRSSSYANLAKILVENESSSQNGNLQFHTRSGGNVNEAMRIASSGEVLIGTDTVDSNFSGKAVFQVAGENRAPLISVTRYQANGSGPYVRIGKSRGASPNTRGIVSENDDIGYLQWVADDGGDLNSGVAQISASIDGTPGVDDTPGRLQFYTTADGSSGPTERMRINSNGDMTLGEDIGSNAGYLLKLVAQGTVQLINRTGTDGTLILFQNDGSNVGSVSTSGSSTAYNTSSDYRLKENVVDLTGATDRLKQLNPSRFNFIADADTTVDGFLAHEVQAVVPEAITGTKDAVGADGKPEYQGIDQSKLVPLLTAALQEALTKIETLEARITALENA
jgi:hypothetical protein